jgi:hypothetical protein
LMDLKAISTEVEKGRATSRCMDVEKGLRFS